ncbi:KAT8 regulatory NSL complex subunit 3-like isoform X1 [Pieris napi]|uniref:KAT8 regulatory NSL complex subunit 3-like isoform X1 n=1 Tax=Pieris napi TaxID=78633 RepID=UPI001FBB87AC|nr:KAT8 regulatory NSL complex subunit 3-like isoform X1 [Pieris napi]
MPMCEPRKLLQADMQESARLECGQRPLSPSTLHERLVGHALAVTDDLEGRSGVWGEHSYARERGAAPHSRVRTLLLPRAPLAAQSAPLALVDAHSPPAARPAPPLDRPDDSDSNDDDATDAADWERIVLDAATTEARRRLAGAVVRLLAEMRLRRLAVDRSRWRRAESVRGAATRLRGALATATAGDSAWLHGVMLAHLPRSQRTPYERVTGELRRVAPRLAARLAPDAPPPPAEPLDAAPPPLDAATPGPWLGWVSAGLERRDERWRRRLGALIHVRPLGGGSAGAGAPPERWCATRAHAVRSALVRLLQEAGSRPVVLGGFGAGAALAARLASARGVRGAVLLAPPLLTAEGPDEPPGEAPSAALLVAGGAAATTGRGAAAQMASGGGSRRLLLVAGADDALRLPRRHRLRLGLPQQALDAAIAEECARWIGEVCAEEEDERTEECAGVAVAADVSPGAGAAEGRVVSRVSGGTPLALRPPGGRRADFHAADIMRLPIVFADDLPDASEPKEERLRVVAGATRTTRVIVTKRSALEAAPSVRRPRAADPQRRRP